MPATPTYVYKLISSHCPLNLPVVEPLPVSDLDNRSGFIHLSTALQVPHTLERFFGDDDLVWIVRIDYKKVEKNIKWENSDGTSSGGIGEPNIFPHLYNGLIIGVWEIDSTRTWDKRDKGWGPAIEESQSEGWFIY